MASGRNYDYYVTSGNVRGECKHAHRTLAAATRCLRRDERGCQSQGGYSDRAVYLVEPSGAMTFMAPDYDAYDA